MPRKPDLMKPQNAASVHSPPARVRGTRFVFALRPAIATIFPFNRFVAKNLHRGRCVESESNPIASNLNDLDDDRRVANCQSRR